jgi:hypothetical protein
VTEWIEIGAPGWNRVTEYTVTWSGLGLLRDRIGRYTIHKFERTTTCQNYTCNCPQSGHYLKRSGVLRKPTDDEIVTLPLCRDNYEAPTEPCARCGNVEYLEQHHWAPRHLFGDDCNNWPMSGLCRKCHAEWHRIVTPNMHLTNRTAG